MGRNPVVGRQGPAYHAATIPSEAEAQRAHGQADPLRRSATRRPCARTLRALGLRHHQQTIEVVEHGVGPRHAVQGASPRRGDAGWRRSDGERRSSTV